jgi:hypothetical protein
MSEPVIDVKVENHGTIMLFRLLTDAAEEWVDENVPDNSQYWSDSLVVEPRYAEDLALGMIEAGLEVR